MRWILVHDPAGELDPKAFLSTDQDPGPVEILTFFVRLWKVELTFAELVRLQVRAQVRTRKVRIAPATAILSAPQYREHSFSSSTPAA